MNAYLGARPIARALEEGAQIVITGKCADSAVVLGPLMHEFNWADNDYDLLAAGSLAGHVIECGAQVTGGNFTDWKQTADTWHNIGFPIVEVEIDGKFTVSKPADTGGLVSSATVCEQVLYELGDPGSYILPDVVCAFRHLVVEDIAPNKVRVSGAKGRGSTLSYKVNATFLDGYRATAFFMIGGIDAKIKGEAVANAILKRTSSLFENRSLSNYKETSVEILGAESTYGPHSCGYASREVVVKIAVSHQSQDALKIFTSEIAPAVTGMAPGVTGIFGGRPRISPVVRLHSFLINKELVPSFVQIDGPWIKVIPHMPLKHFTVPKTDLVTQTLEICDDCSNLQAVRLGDLVYTRSGDKGNAANIGVIARHVEFVPILRDKLTEKVVANYLAHLVLGRVKRYELPGINAFNFVLTDALGGGGTASLRMDPQGKAFAQMLLDLKLSIPANLAKRHRISKPKRIAFL